MAGTAVVAATGTAAAAKPAVAEPVNHHGDALLRVETWPEEAHALGLDVWTHRTAVPSVLARVTQAQWSMLDASGVAYTVVDPDIGPRIDAERARLAAAPLLGGGLDPTFYDEFRDFATVLDRLAALAAAQPGRVSVVEAGLSIEGRPIRGLRITNPGGPADRPVVLVQGTMHAREWIAVAATVFAAEQFATAPVVGALDDLLDQAELLVVPVVNPDGYVYTWDVERLWRKNRRDGIGVDLNRNWSVAWGGQGASPVPEDEIYHGAAPFSEPESAAMRDLIDAEPDMIAMLDVHSFGQLLLYPWGYDYVDSVDDMLFDDMAYQLASPMQVPHGQWYEPLQSSDLYPASGNAIDWAYGVHGLYALTVELRPTFVEDWGFLLPPDQIVPTGEELVIGISQLVEASVALGPGAPGDSGGVETDGTEESTGGSSSEGTTTGGGDEQSTTGSTGGESPTTSGSPTSGGDSGVEPPPPLPGETGEDGDSSGGGEPGQDGGDGGCGCRTHGDGGLPGWWLLPVLGLRRRRR